MAEPLKLQGEGEYNLDVVKEVKVTDSFLGMDEEERGCQNKEDYQSCTTRHYIDQVKKTCKCLPLYLKINDKGRVKKKSMEISVRGGVKPVFFFVSSIHP